MLGRVGQFDGVVANAIMLPLWSMHFSFAIVNIQQSKSVLDVNKNASVTYDVTSGFNVISKYYSKVNS